MLRIYEVALSLVAEVAPLVAAIARQDADLARQCRRALASGPLNIAEGSYSKGGLRATRYSNANGSMREALACIELGAALGYVAPVSAELRNRFDHIIGTLVKCGAR